MSDSKEPLDDAKIAQFTELNNRGRWYSSQLWQVPFAYLGITAVAVAQAAEKSPRFLPLALFGCAVFGVCVLVHFRGMMDGEKRAVEDLIKVERDDLHLRPTTEYKSQIYVLPLMFIMILTVGAYAVMGAVLLFERCP